MEALSEKAYASWNNDEEQRLKSSSGGLAAAFANYIIAAEGITYGVVENSNGLGFKKITLAEEIELFHGSKYYQADVNLLDFAQFILDVEMGVPLLILGTPCQIGMFVTVLQDKFKKIPGNIIFVDIICHGVGSKKYVDVYRNELCKNNKLVKHSFRNKKEGRIGSQYSEYIYENGESVSVENEKDYYMRFFSPNYFLRPSCYKCIYAGKYKLSDITIGDFNGSKNIVKNYPDSTHCISAMIVHTQKGNQFIEKLKCMKLITLIETSYSVIAAQNLPLVVACKKPYIRKYVYRLIDTIGFINTCRLLSGKYYIKRLLLLLGGRSFLNKLKKFFGRIIIEQ